MCVWVGGCGWVCVCANEIFVTTKLITRKIKIINHWKTPIFTDLNASSK